MYGGMDYLDSIRNSAAAGMEGQAVAGFGAGSGAGMKGQAVAGFGAGSAAGMERQAVAGFGAESGAGMEGQAVPVTSPPLCPLTSTPKPVPPHTHTAYPKTRTPPPQHTHTPPFNPHLRWRQLAVQTPALAFATPLVEALASSSKPILPESGTGLLPVHAGPRYCRCMRVHDTAGGEGPGGQ